MWEKATGINTSEKKKRFTKGKLPDSSRDMQCSEEEGGNNREKRAQIEGKEEGKKEKIEKIEKTWVGSVVNYIGNRLKPFFYGFNG